MATTPAASRPDRAPQFDKYTAIDPFGGFDLNLLYAAATTAPAPTK